MLSARQVSTNRSQDSQGGGNFPSLHDLMNKRIVETTPFGTTPITVTGAQHVLLDNTKLTGNLAIGTDSTETNGGLQAAALAGSVGSAALTAISDSEGSTTNLVELREGTTNDPILTVDGRKVYGLLQADSTANDGDAVGGVSSENCQLSFVYVGSDGGLALATITEDVEIAVPKLYALRHEPSYRKKGVGSSKADVIDPGAVPHEPLVRRYIVTTAFPASDVLDIITGDGTTGISTASRDTLTTIGATLAIFNDTDIIDVRLNGVQLDKGTDVIWDSATTLHFTFILDPNDIFEIEVPDTL